MEYTWPSSNPFISEYLAHALSFLYLNLEKKMSKIYLLSSRKYSLDRHATLLVAILFKSCIEKSENFRI